MLHRFQRRVQTHLVNLSFPASRSSNSQSRHCSTGSTLYVGNGVLGIVREQYGMWERRAPLNPDQVRHLIEKHNFRVIVQPSSLRIFSNDEYIDAGATLSEDLSDACLVLGIKRISPANIQRGKSYMFFGHVIKAQKSNFDILDKLLESKARLFDYECITEDGKNNRPRLVAFGKFAGMAGMIDGLQGLGLKLLAEGFTTPFLNVPLAYMHKDLSAARESLKIMGQQLALKGVKKTSPIEPISNTMKNKTFVNNNGTGFDPQIEGKSPQEGSTLDGRNIDNLKSASNLAGKHGKQCVTVIAFTGSGNVTKGAREMFELLPHEYVTAEELPNLQVEVEQGIRSGNKIYSVLLHLEDLVRLKKTNPVPSAHPKKINSSTQDSEYPKVDKIHYYANPDLYESVFHDKIAPYVTMIVNGIYWDFRYPRILTKNQLLNLRKSGNTNLKVIADITCDMKGSFEFLSHATSIEKPFFTYISETDQDVEGVNEKGILLLGVDILPSELPKDASDYFGTALYPLLAPILQSKGSESPDILPDLPPELRRACITSHGRLADRWSYIARLRELQQVPIGTAVNYSDSTIMDLEMRGHLFDSGLINKVLDLLEIKSTEIREKVQDPLQTKSLPNFSFSIVNCDVRPNTAVSPTPSMVTVRLTGPQGTLQEVSESILALGDSHQTAHTNIKITTTTMRTPSPKRVLLFGSGRVAKPLIRLLTEHEDVHIIVASEFEEQAREIMNCASQKASSHSDSVNGSAERCTFQPFRFPDDNHLLPQLFASCDVAVSLLPATMHIPLAEQAISQGKHFVTASYVSEDMRNLDAKAREKGVILLNEVGLDPGIDHMLLMKAVRAIQDKGGVVTELVSLCGGIPDPVAADNPLKYKVSWSPRGMLAAATNSATYMKNGQMMYVSGADLLTAAIPCERFPTMRMEVLPNRDSLAYRDLYGVNDVTDICRGTLRYCGWADIMQSLKVLNLLSTEKFGNASICTWIDLLNDGIAKLETQHIQLLQQSNPTGGHWHFKPRGEYTINDRLRRVLSLEVCGVKDVEGAVDALGWLGISRSLRGSAALEGHTPIDALSHLMTSHSGLTYQQGERDMVAMYHTVCGRMPDGSQERHTSQLMCFGAPKERNEGDKADIGERGMERGDEMKNNNQMGINKDKEREREREEGDSAMSATVGYTTAAAVELLLNLNPHIKNKDSGSGPGSLPLGGRSGVLIPITADIYDPILRRLNDFSITWTETITITGKEE